MIQDHCIELRVNQVPWHSQNLPRRLHKLFLWKKTMARSGNRLPQDKVDSGMNAILTDPLNPHRLSNLIGGLKPDSVDVLNKTIWIGRDDLLDILVVLLEDLDRELWRNVILLQEQHRLTLLRLLGIALRNHLRLLFTNA